MPASLYDRIPRSSYDADAMLGERASLTLGHATALTRASLPWEGPESNWINLTYHGSAIVMYWPDGRVQVSTCGFATRTTIARLRRVLPLGWTMTFRPSAVRYARVHVVYREAYSISMADEPVTFLPNGGVRTAYMTLSRADLDSYVTSSQATMEMDIIRERGRAARAAYARRGRRAPAATRRRAPRQTSPSPAPSNTWADASERLRADLLRMREAEALATARAAIADAERCHSGACHDAGHAEHYGTLCRTDPFCLCAVECDCRGVIPQSASEGALHGRYACFGPTTPEDVDAAWQRAQSWLQPAIERFRAATASEPEPCCDYCNYPQGEYAEDWNGETGMHRSCERIAAAGEV